jgi:hypothetical protein
MGIFALPAGPARAAEPAQYRQVISDFNRDGAADRIQLTGDTLSLQFSDAQPAVELQKKIVGFATGDIDDDGDRDVVALSAKGNLHVWRNDGRGRFGHFQVPLPKRGNALGRGDAGLTADAEQDLGVEPVSQRLFAPAFAVARLTPPEGADIDPAQFVAAPASAVLALLPARAPPVRLSA